MKNLYQKINYAFIFALIGYLPFQSLLLFYLKNGLSLGTGISFWTAHWYEPLLAIFSLINLIVILRQKNIDKLWLRLILSLLTLGIISVFFFSPSVSQGLQGFRISLFFLLAIFQVPSYEKSFDKILNFYGLMAVLIAVFGIIERFLPLNYWHSLFQATADFGWGNFLVGTTERSSSILGGPNQLGSYLLPAAFLFLYKSSDWAKIKNFFFDRQFFFYALIVMAIGFSYSRAAFLGLLAGLLVFIIYRVKKWQPALKMLLTTGVLMAIPLSILFVGGNSTATVLTHDSSQMGHNNAIINSVKEISYRFDNVSDLLLGSGLSTAGPLALKYGGIVSESWYLQIVLELGFLGILFWLGFALVILIKLKDSSFVLFLSLFAVSITALFLHTFADNPALTITLFLLIGVNFAELKLKEVK